MMTAEGAIINERHAYIVISREVFLCVVGVILSILAWGAFVTIGSGENTKVQQQQMMQITAQIAQVQLDVTKLVTVVQTSSENAVETRVRLQGAIDRLAKVETNMGDLWDRVTVEQAQRKAGR